MRWHEGPLLAFDTETTGPNPNTARIVTAATVWLTPGKPPEPVVWLADPGIPIPQAATDVHGITTERARAEGLPAAEVVGMVAASLEQAYAVGIPVVGHNVAYDLTVLAREGCRHGSGWPVPCVIDTYVLDKHAWPYRKGKRTLETTCETYRVPFHGDAHDAAADALAAARIAYRIAQIAHTPAADRPPEHAARGQRWDDLAGLTIADLHNYQKLWKAAQAESLEQYFRRTDPDAVVSRDWPVQAFPDDWTPDAADEPEGGAA